MYTFCQVYYVIYYVIKSRTCFHGTHIVFIIHTA